MRIRCFTIFRIPSGYSVDFRIMPLLNLLYCLFTFYAIFFLMQKNKCFSLISFSNFSDVLLAFASARAIGNLLSICLGVNILIPVPCVDFIGNIPILEAFRVHHRPS